MFLDKLVTSVVKLRWLRRTVVAVINLALMSLCSYAAIWLRFDGAIPPSEWSPWVAAFPWIIVIQAVSFVPFRLYEGLWRYTSIFDLRNLVLATTLGSLSAYAFVHFILGITSYPRSVFIIDALLLTFAAGGLRVTQRVYREIRFQSRGRRVLVFGAGNAGEMIVREMRANRGYDAEAIGFIDDDREKRGLRIHGVPVLGGRDVLPDVMPRLKPEEVLVAIPSADPPTLRRILHALQPYKVRITTLPRLQDLIGSTVGVNQIRQLRVEDLLQRTPVGLDPAPVKNLLQNKRIIITGAGGSIGSELCRQIAAIGPANLILLERYESALFSISNELRASHPDTRIQSIIGDVTDTVRIDDVFQTWRPQVVFHAAAHKHVPLMEDNPLEAIKNNVTGTRRVAEAANRFEAERFILISTDKAVRPRSVMGATKRVAEMLVISMARRGRTTFRAVRFGNVLGSNGSVVPTFLAQIQAGGPVTVTHPEVKRYFMLIPEAVQLVLQAAALDNPESAYILDMGDQIRVVELARDLIRLCGFIPEEIPIHFVGLRPGEKLEEELIDYNEAAERSSVGKVLRIVPKVPLAVDDEAIAMLERLAADGKVEAALAQLKRVLINVTELEAATETVH